MVKLLTKNFVLLKKRDTDDSDDEMHNTYDELWY
jgi:hypothetical protein